VARASSCSTQFVAVLNVMDSDMPMLHTLQSQVCPCGRQVLPSATGLHQGPCYLGASALAAHLLSGLKATLQVDD
jgi:hypothetical protein